jgi:glutamate racemase
MKVGDFDAPRVSVFDSGLGGLTVLTEIVKARPDVDIVYAADDARFPYGEMGETELVDRVGAVIADLVEATNPDVVVIACNTASTLVLAPLRAAHPGIAFVGTVPAIKPAAEASRSGLISVLATPGTVARDYTLALIRDFAARCEVELVGAAHLAGIAEQRLHDQPIDIEAVRREIAACFVQRGARRTDKVVLACTHFPLLLDVFAQISPWEVDFIDPAPAIARRVDALVGPPRRGSVKRAGPTPACFTSGRAPGPGLQKALHRLGLAFSSELLRPVRACSAVLRGRMETLSERPFLCARNWGKRFAWKTIALQITSSTPSNWTYR